jgi:hypothetical protein
LDENVDAGVSFLEGLSLSSEVFKDELDKGHYGNQEGSDSECSHVVEEGMANSKRDLNIILDTIGIRTLAKEVPLACRRGNDEVSESCEPNYNPKNTNKQYIE